MSDAVQDIWHDLRAKRLWPVAALLLVGLVAIPAAMMKSASSPAPQAAPADVAEGAPAVAEIDVTDAVDTGAGSSLDRFSARDPFRPPSSVTKGGESVDGSGSATAGAADASGEPGAATPSDGGTGDDGAAGGDPGTVSPSPDPAPEPPPTVTAEFEYVADVTFWSGDRRKRFPRLRKLDMLPNQAAPVLIFMGVTAKGGNAVFLVDSTLRAAGEGRCVPNGANCAYVHVGPGSEHAFTTDDGDSYRLRVGEIRRVESGGKASGSKAAKRRARTADRGLRRFALPRLVDLVEVTGPATAGDAESASGDGEEGR